MTIPMRQKIAMRKYFLIIRKLLKYGQRDTQIEIYTDREIYGQKDIQIVRYTDSEIYR